METYLSELEHDALGEISNMAVCRAANVLNEMIGMEITLSVPEILLINTDQLTDNLSGLKNKDLTIVQQNFSGQVAGVASMAFPEEKSLELVRLLLGEEMSLDEIVELEQDALQEIGNVILNAFLGVFGNELGVAISSDIPMFKKDVELDQLLGGGSHESTTTIFIHVDFNISDKNIEGYLVLTVSISALEKLIALIRTYLEKLM